MRSSHPLSPFRGVFLLIALFALLAGRASPAAAQDQVGLYLTWSRDPATTMTVNWVDVLADGPTEVYYRALPADAVERKPSTRPVAADAFSVAKVGPNGVATLKPSVMIRRRVELTGLSPSTVYQFGIGKPPATEAEGFRFRTLPATLDRPLRFVSGGDMMHSRELLDPMTKQAAAFAPDFAIFGGDLAYEDGRSSSRIADFLLSWRRLGVTPDGRLIPVVPVIGNHEVTKGYNGKIPDDAPFFYGLYDLPEGRAYHALDFGTYLSLIVLDSGHTNPIPGPQADWLRGALEARTGQTFVIPVYHYPAYGTTKAPAPGKTSIDHPRSISIRENWVSLFERFGVTAVFENDHHNYKRTVPIRNHQRDDANGITYLGDGAWGVAVRTVPEPGTAWWLAKAEGRNHVWVVDLNPDGTSTYRAVDNKGVVFDEVTLTRPRTPPAR